MAKLKYHFDCWLNSKSVKNLPNKLIQTSFGMVRYIDEGDKSKPCVIMAPDGPSVLEHFSKLIDELKNDFRVVVFDMPGFGFSYPINGYNHSLQSGSQVIKEVLDFLKIPKATLAFSCANGFYALIFATLNPNRVERIFSIQTPSFSEMENWVTRRIPLVLKIGFIGQIFSFLAKKKTPARWYPAALPKTTDKKPWIDISLKNIEHGGCNCLAGVVQGLSESNQTQTPINVKCPTIMIWGTQDKSHTPTDPQSFLSLVPHAKIEIWNHVGHFGNLEDTKKFRELLLSSRQVNK